MKLKILSWNIWIYGNYEKITHFLRNADADIVGLQEVRDDDPNLDIIGFMKTLGYNYRFSAIETPTGKIFPRNGPAIFSKYPIISSQEYDVHPDDKRRLLHAAIDVNGQKLNIFNTHLTHTHQKESDAQLDQARNIAQLLEPGSTILMGDFNATPHSRTIREISLSLNNPNKSNEPTWCVYKEGCEICMLDEVNVTLDYIFTSKNIKAKEFTVGDSLGSDHLPILVEVEL